MSDSSVQPWLDDGDLRLYHGDALEVLRSLPAGIAQTCVTSPPYWGLRDYGTGAWTGGDEACDHQPPMGEAAGLGSSTLEGGKKTTAYQQTGYGAACGKCGAQRVDSQLGLEATPTLYVENMVNLFREVRRVLRDDGTCWINLGDSYASGNGAGDSGRSGATAQTANTIANVQYRAPIVAGLKPKDLCGIPWRVAFALQADGWYLRSDIIWSKPNPMPESVTDRPTKAHEYLFLFSKQPRYFYDADAIREPNETAERRPAYAAAITGNRKHEHFGANIESRRVHAGDNGYINPAGRNRRSVWTIPTQPFPDAHFATYPEELVRPCILAGTSERGECAECGAPWQRQVERELEATRGVIHPDAKRREPMVATSADHSGGVYGRYRVETTGWEPSCECEDPILNLAPALTRPQLVLDPFCGSGTTNLVARKHGRRSIGIDLSAEYLEIAAKRTQQLSLLDGVA